MPLSKPLGSDDVRSPSQRRADALVEIAEQTLTRGELPTVAGHRPAVNVTISLPSLQKLPGTPGGELDWAGDVTAETARRIGCDATVRRILLGPDRQPLDVGRAKRLVTPATRRISDTRRRLHLDRPQQHTLHPPQLVVRRSPHHILGRRRRHQPGKPPAPLPHPPPTNPRHTAPGKEPVAVSSTSRKASVQAVAHQHTEGLVVPSVGQVCL